MGMQWPCKLVKGAMRLLACRTGSSLLVGFPALCALCCRCARSSKSTRRSSRSCRGHWRRATPRVGAEGGQQVLRAVGRGCRHAGATCCVERTRRGRSRAPALRVTSAADWLLVDAAELREVEESKNAHIQSLMQSHEKVGANWQEGLL